MILYGSYRRHRYYRMTHIFVSKLKPTIPTSIQTVGGVIENSDLVVKKFKTDSGPRETIIICSCFLVLDESDSIKFQILSKKDVILLNTQFTLVRYMSYKLSGLKTSQRFCFQQWVFVFVHYTGVCRVSCRNNVKMSESNISQVICKLTDKIRSVVFAKVA